jgi:alginate O-acetyltransferase complex protein AlgI
MGGNRAGRARTYANLLVVFFLCGLWHGASWTFVIWGLYHGLFLVLERLGLRDVLGRSGRPVGHVYTMLVVMVGWVLFRAEDLGHALSFLGAMAGMGHGDGVAYHAGLYLRPEVALGIVAGAVGSTPVLPRLKHLFEQRRWGWRPIARSYLTTAVYFAHFFGLAVLLLLVAMSLAAGTHNPFIYFRF